MSRDKSFELNTLRIPSSLTLVLHQEFELYAFEHNSCPALTKTLTSDPFYLHETVR
jgi:hypothetical protein